MKEAYHQMIRKLREGHTIKNVVVHCITWKIFVKKHVLNKDMLGIRRKHHGVVILLMLHLPSSPPLFVVPKIDMNKREVACVNPWIKREIRMLFNYLFPSTLFIKKYYFLKFI